MTKEQYKTALLDPRWQALRRNVLARDSHRCQVCDRDDVELHVHHKRYAKNGGMPWEVPISWLITLCKEHHSEYHAKQIAGEAKYMKNRHKKTIFVTTVREKPKKEQAKYNAAGEELFAHY